MKKNLLLRKLARKTIKIRMSWNVMRMSIQWRNLILLLCQISNSKPYCLDMRNCVVVSYFCYESCRLDTYPLDFRTDSGKYYMFSDREGDRCGTQPNVLSTLLVSSPNTHTQKFLLGDTDGSLCILAAPEVVMLATSGAVSDAKLINMTTFLFQLR